jgi:hypothetical protein
MNSKMLLLAGVLIFVLGIKYAFGQAVETAMNWDPLLQEDPVQDVAAIMVAAPILGGVFGACRLLRANSSRPSLVFLRLD